MAEVRKPTFVFLLRKVSKTKGKKTHKIEVYPGTLWQEYEKDVPRRGVGATLSYRLRVNGKWFPKGVVRFYKKTEIKNIIWKAIRLSDEQRS